MLLPFEMNYLRSIVQLAQLTINLSMKKGYDYSTGENVALGFGQSEYVRVRRDKFLRKI
jgi:hypothetical protein